jgi:hypothetical protein
LRIVRRNSASPMRRVVARTHCRRAFVRLAQGNRGLRRRWHAACNALLAHHNTEHGFMKNTLIGLLTTLAFANCVQAADVANVRILGDAGEHAVEIDLDALKVGESRQLATEVALGGHGDLLWIGKHGEGDGHKRVQVMKLDSEAVKEIDLGDGQRKVIVMRQHGEHGSGEPLDEAKLAELIAEIEAKAGADGDQAGKERVFVTRKITRDSEQ